MHSKEKDEACLGLLEEIFTKSVHRGGVFFIKKNPKEGTFFHTIVILFSDPEFLVQFRMQSIVAAGW